MSEIHRLTQERIARDVFPDVRPRGTSVPLPCVESCPGCGVTILVPAPPSKATWATKAHWCRGCGGHAPVVVPTLVDCPDLPMGWVAR